VPYFLTFGLDGMFPVNSLRSNYLPSWALIRGPSASPPRLVAPLVSFLHSLTPPQLAHVAADSALLMLPAKGTGDEACAPVFSLCGGTPPTLPFSYRQVKRLVPG